MLDDAPPAGGAVRARADEIGPIPPEPAWDASDWDGLIRVLPFATGNSQPVREMLAAGLSAQIDLGGYPAVACRLPTTVPTGPKAARPVQRVHIKPALAFHGAPPGTPPDPKPPMVAAFSAVPPARTRGKKLSAGYREKGPTRRDGFVRSFQHFPSERDRGFGIRLPPAESHANRDDSDNLECCRPALNPIQRAGYNRRKKTGRPSARTRGGAAAPGNDRTRRSPAFRR
jgi:hypothetical protein